jgi:catechol 2,3-dioxygenase
MSKDFMNREIICPTLHHYGLTTSNPKAMRDWYGKVLGMTTIHQTTHPAGAQTPPGVEADWVTNDRANHRVAFVSAPGMIDDLDRSHHHRVQHVAFEYQSIDDLLATYARLKGQGIQPVLTTDTGATTAFYYEDPDGNVVELLADNFGDWAKSTEFMRTSSKFAAKPIGAFVDPNKMIAARAAGMQPDELHRRAYDGEFPPSKPMDPTAIM